MPAIAGFRGALWDPTKVELAKVVASPVSGVKDRLASGELVRDPVRAVYRYHQVFSDSGRTITRQNVIVAARLTPWSEGQIRPHEATDPTARDAAAASIAAAGAHTEPVFAGYRDSAREVDRLFRRAESEPPTIEVTTPDRTIHRLWRVASAEIIGKLRPLFAPKRMHVLDGHARYEGMLAYAEKIGAEDAPQYSSAKYGLVCISNLDEPTFVIAARHRLVRSDGFKRDAVLDAAKKYFIVDKLAGLAGDAAKLEREVIETTAHQPTFVTVFAGDADAWKLTLKSDVSPVGEGIDVHRAIQKYDPVVVESLFLRRVLQTAAATTDVDAASVVSAVKAGASIGMIMRPMTLDQIVHTDEVGAVLPFGSTAFLPPLANLVTYVVDLDEDVV